MENGHAKRTEKEEKKSGDCDREKTKIEKTKESHIWGCQRRWGASKYLIEERKGPTGVEKENGRYSGKNREGRGERRHSLRKKGVGTREENKFDTFSCRFWEKRREMGGPSRHNGVRRKLIRRKYEEVAGSL